MLIIRKNIFILFFSIYFKTKVDFFRNIKRKIYGYMVKGEFSTENTSEKIFYVVRGVYEY